MAAKHMMSTISTTAAKCPPGTWMVSFTREATHCDDCSVAWNRTARYHTVDLFDVGLEMQAKR
jgi:hypothetical protein